jgi:hypothetical protein
MIVMRLSPLTKNQSSKIFYLCESFCRSLK